MRLMSGVPASRSAKSRPAWPRSLSVAIATRPARRSPARGPSAPRAPPSHLAPARSPAMRLRRYAAGHAAQQHRPHRPIAAGAAHQQVEMLGHPDERLGRIPDECLDLDGNIGAERGHHALEGLLRAQPVFTLDVDEVPPSLAGNGGSVSACALSFTVATVSTRSVAPARWASAWAPRSASRPSSLSVSPTPYAQLPRAVQPVGTVATGQGAPCMSRSCRRSRQDSSHA